MEIRAYDENDKLALKLDGDALDSFQRIDEVESIILLGKKGSIRRIILHEP